LFFLKANLYFAEVMKLVDVPDSKSGEGNLVGVRFPLMSFVISTNLISF
jgi:hypothetical protein